MHCPFCQHTTTKVIDSRTDDNGSRTRRRRQCLACDKRFSTIEQSLLDYPKVIKSNKKRETFSIDKIRNGLLHATSGRPIETARIEQLLSDIQEKLRTLGSREVSTQKIGDWVMERLSRLDKVAYLRFASVYLKFDNVDAFLEEIQRLGSSSLSENGQADLFQLGSDEKH